MFLLVFLGVGTFMLHKASVEVSHLSACSWELRRVILASNSYHPPYHIYTFQSGHHIEKDSLETLPVGYLDSQRLNIVAAAWLLFLVRDNSVVYQGMF